MNRRGLLPCKPIRATREGADMATYYVEDYDGKRNKDAEPAAPAEVEATPVENDPETKVVTAPEKSAPKTSNADVTTKG